jgi:2-keto-4-pentenoate hydratase/2-oxohepta-3-ene-1,7-dioic acid hydratase in catechol pathway
MRLVSFNTGNNPLRAGLIVGDHVVDAHRGGMALLHRNLPATVRGILAKGPSCLRLLEQLHGRAGESLATTPDVTWAYPLDGVHLGPPVPDPDKIICIGQNYKDHCAEQGVPLPTRPIIFTKFVTSLTGPRDPIVLPRASEKVDYEVELAFVIGKGGKHIPEKDALEHVAGYMAFNDISARDIQFGDGQWTRGKSCDTFAPCGPALVTRDEVPDPGNLALELRLNGQVMQSSNTNQMVFGVAALVAFLSQTITLAPGDIVSTGTPPGVGVFRKPPVLLKPGDKVVATVERLGSLENVCVAEEL